MAQEYTEITVKDPSATPGSVTSCDFTYMERRPWIRDWYLFGVMRAVYDVAVDIYTAVTSILAKLNQNCDGDPIAVAICDDVPVSIDGTITGAVEIADSTVRWTPTVTLATTSGSISAASVKSVSFHIPATNTTDATVGGVVIPKGLTISFGGVEGRLNGPAIAYTASATANILITTSN